MSEPSTTIHTTVATAAVATLQQMGTVVGPSVGNGPLPPPQQQGNTGNNTKRRTVAKVKAEAAHHGDEDKTKKRKSTRISKTEKYNSDDPVLTNLCRLDGIPSWFQLRNHFLTETSVDDFFVRRRIFQLPTTCPRIQCRALLPAPRKGRLRCRKCESIHGKEWSMAIYANTFFDKSRIPRGDILVFLYYWLIECKQKQLCLVTGWTKTTIMNFTKYAQELVGTTLVEADEDEEDVQQPLLPVDKIGGNRVHVQIADMTLGRKYLLQPVGDATSASAAHDESGGQNDRGLASTGAANASDKNHDGNTATEYQIKDEQVLPESDQFADAPNEEAKDDSHDAKAEDQKWLLVGVEVSPARKYFCCVVEDRNQNTLIKALRKYVAAGSILRVDAGTWNSNDILALEVDYDYHYPEDPSIVSKSNPHNETQNNTGDTIPPRNNIPLQLDTQNNTNIYNDNMPNQFLPANSQQPNQFQNQLTNNNDNNNGWDDLFWGAANTPLMQPNQVPNAMALPPVGMVNATHYSNIPANNNTMNNIIHTTTTTTVAGLPPTAMTVGTTTTGTTTLATTNGPLIAVKRSHATAQRKFNNAPPLQGCLWEFIWRRKHKGNLWNALVQALGKVRYKYAYRMNEAQVETRKRDRSKEVERRKQIQKQKQQTAKEIMMDK